VNKLSNRFYEAQDMFNNNDFTFSSLNGLNEVASAQYKITIEGNIDDFTKSTLFRNYDRIAENLKVYPTITIYPRGHKLNGGMGGFYNPTSNHIDMLDNYYLISILAHEMRHAFQYIYFPDLFFATEYRSAREYLNSYVERDARGYELDYCTAREYWEEAAYIREQEEQKELVIQGKLSPKALGISEVYFRLNPAQASSVPRDYHVQKNYTYNSRQTYGQGEVVVYKKKKSLWRSFVDVLCTIVRWGVITIIFLFMLGLLLIMYT